MPLDKKRLMAHLAAASKKPATPKSPALLRKLLSGEKLSTDDQKAVAAVCRVVGYLQ